MKNRLLIAVVAVVACTAGCPDANNNDSVSQVQSGNATTPATDQPKAETGTPPGGSRHSQGNASFRPAIQPGAYPGPLQSASWLNDEISATMEQNGIATVQTSAVRAPIDFNYRLTGPLDLRRIEGGIPTSEERPDGTVKIELDGTIIWQAPIVVEQGQILINAQLAPVRLTAGTHRIRVLVESNHSTGDSMQGEIRRIVTDKTDHKVVFRWPSVLCG